MRAADERGGRTVAHWWTCAAKGPIVETVTRDAVGQGRIILRCATCGGDDQGVNPADTPEDAA